MSATPTVEGQPPADIVRTHVRGSSLLLAGRFLQLAANLAVQIMVVRYLSRAGYGAFAYALAFAVLGETIALFGFDRAVGRLVPIYLERRNFARAFGVLVLSVGCVLSIGAILVVAVLGARGWIEHGLVHDSRSASLILIMVALAPIQALEDLLRGMFSVLARPKTIFFRAFVLEPLFRIAVVLVLIATHQSVYFLAGGYVVAGGVGVLISVFLTLRILRQEGLLQHFRLREIEIPVRETFGFTLPLLSTDVVNVLLFSSDAMLLGHFRPPADVGAFRVVFPAASLNIIPSTVFTVLFIPVAARLFARSDWPGIGDLYRRTTLWISLASFPIFALTFTGAVPVTTLLFGSAYRGSATYLSILALGYYVQAVFVFSGITLTVYGRVRALTALNVSAMIVNLSLNLFLIPRYGPLGASLGTTSTLIAHNAAKQILLRRVTGLHLVTRDTVRGLAVLAAAVAVSIALEPLVVREPQVAIVAAAATSGFVVWWGRQFLDITGMFPEVLGFPGVRRVAALRARAR